MKSIPIFPVSSHQDMIGCNNAIFDGTTWNAFTTSGGHLDIPNTDVSLFIPLGAIKCDITQKLFLSIPRGSYQKPLLDESEAQLSPIISAGPRYTEFEKYIILTVPHNAVIASNQWKIKVLQAKRQNNSETPWQVIATNDSENFTQTAYIHVLPDRACILVKNLDTFNIVGHSNPHSGLKASIHVKMLVFSNQLNTDLYDHAIRVYIIPDTKEAFNNVYLIESKSFGQLINASTPLWFTDNGENLVITLEDISVGWKTRHGSQTQLIKFSTIWRSHISAGLMSVFVLNKQDSMINFFSCNIVAYQDSNYSGRVVIPVMKQKQQNHDMSNIMWSKSNPTFIDQSDHKTSHPVFENSRLSSQTITDLCNLLNKFDSSSNDWRLLARELQIQRTDFFVNSNPTETLLNLFQAIHREKSLTKDLISIFQRYKRYDCISILEKNEGY